jgi:hypothetical protein
MCEPSLQHRLHPGRSCVSPVIYARGTTCLLGSSLLPFCANTCPLASSSSLAFLALAFEVVALCAMMMPDAWLRKGIRATIRTPFSSPSSPLPSERWLNTAPCLLPFSISPSKPAAPEGSTLRSAYGGGPWDPFRYTVPVVGTKVLYCTVILVKFIPLTVPQVQNSTGP